MSEKTVITFNCISFLFGLYMLASWNKLLIGFPVIRAYYPFGVFHDFYPESVPGFGSPGTNFTVDESVPISINSNPNPTVVFLADVCMLFVQLNNLDS